MHVWMRAVCGCLCLVQCCLHCRFNGAEAANERTDGCVWRFVCSIVHVCWRTMARRIYVLQRRIYVLTAVMHVYCAHSGQWCAMHIGLLYWARCIAFLFYTRIVQNTVGMILYLCLWTNVKLNAIFVYPFLHDRHFWAILFTHSELGVLEQWKTCNAFELRDAMN